jgi:hypothetical protein
MMKKKQGNRAKRGGAKRQRLEPIFVGSERGGRAVKVVPHPPLCWADPPMYPYEMDNVPNDDGDDVARPSKGVPPTLLGIDLLATRGGREAPPSAAEVLPRVVVAPAAAAAATTTKKLEGTDWDFRSECDGTQDVKNVRCSWLFDAMLTSEASTATPPLPSPCAPPQNTAFSLMSDGFLQRLLSG